ncbi:E3 ubiquitin-protein ligase ZNRF2-like [Vombatus ursinus]|uniref:E3 ubiquitin-protein ligase ZNRF2-like n=1 Tax=Vombatus ursinus TaxID=29139 RepID=UPI000FFD40E8|nr:E3 ubiquitin-protein ligase ZNRF2-like [Vombatus ursinus]XP_027728125.1 E3 ubiquitin-protein ligase ZNRF2-like [Vombatus ursinus]
MDRLCPSHGRATVPAAPFERSELELVHRIAPEGWGIPDGLTAIPQHFPQNTQSNSQKKPPQPGTTCSPRGVGREGAASWGRASDGLRPPANQRSRAGGGAIGLSVITGARAAQSAFHIPSSSSSSGPYGSQDSVNSTPDEGRSAAGGPRLVIGSLPAHLSPHMFGGFKCPVCSKFVPSDEMDLHLVMCLTKPRITYNEDVLSKDAGECAICLEELQQGDTIARLPCLCIYHKGCIDEWFEVNRSCPEHPSD